jgi:HlyD family secretion protein
VVRSGATSSVAVTLGVAGSDATQIKSGLEAGQHVVLADLGQPLPAATTSTAGTFRPGQFTSAGGFGGAAGARGSGG